MSILPEVALRHFEKIFLTVPEFCCNVTKPAKIVLRSFNLNSQPKNSLLCVLSSTTNMGYSVNLSSVLGLDVGSDGVWRSQELSWVTTLCAQM